jgi:PAS domain S-box-containing protein
VLDRQHRCAYASPAAERLTGYKLGELRGRPLSLCIHHEHPGWRPYPADECPVTVAIRRNAEAQGEDVLVDRFGNLIPVALTISPIGSGEHPVGFLVEAHDLTAVKRNRLLERTGPEHPGASDG